MPAIAGEERERGQPAQIWKTRERGGGERNRDDTKKKECPFC
jgi:hypothetical protein